MLLTVSPGQYVSGQPAPQSMPCSAPFWMPSVQLSQGWVLHVSLSDSSGHAVPPFTGSVTTVRVRVRIPPPQAAEHTSQSPKSDTSQSTGHSHCPHIPLAWQVRV